MAINISSASNFRNLKAEDGALPTGYTPITADYVASILNKRNDSRYVNYPGYPSDPTDINLREIKGYSDTNGLTKDYFWNPVSGNGIIRNEGTVHETTDPKSDKRYYYYIEKDQTSSEVISDNSNWREIDPTKPELGGKPVSDSTNVLQSPDSVLIFNKNLGNAVTKDELYNAVLKQGNTSSLGLKEIKSDVSTLVLAGLISGDLRFTQNPNETTGVGNGSTLVSENSYIRLSGADSTLVFQKTENDRLYDELSVNIFVAGALDLSGLKTIIVNDNVLINKSSSYLANEGDKRAPTIIFGAPISGGARKHIYVESTNLILSAESSNYAGDWYFGYGSNILFAIPNAQSSNPFGTGKLVARQSAWTFGDNTPDRLKTGNVFSRLGNEIVIDGDPDRTVNRNLTIHESAHNRYYNEISKKYNRIYRILSGGISDGPRGAAGITWGERNDDRYKNESWIFTGDNSKFGLFTGEAGRNDPTKFNEKGYAVSKDFYSWDLGTSDYNMERLGGTTALPWIFGTSGEFNYGENYAAIAGYGSFIYKGTGTNYTSVGFDYDNNVEVGNAFFGNIRYVSLGTGTTKLTNTANELNAGVWILAGGTIEVSDIKALGNGALNILDGTFCYTGTKDAAFVGEVGNKNSAFTMDGAYHCDTEAGNWAIDVANAGTTLSMDATKTSDFDKIEVNTRNKDFTKLGTGTLKITAGNLINPTTNNYVGLGAQSSLANVHIKAGTLQMTGTASLGSIRTLYMEGGSFISEKNLSIVQNYTVEKTESGSVIYKDVDTGGQLFCSTGFDLTNENFSAYDQVMQTAGFSGVVELRYETSSAYESKLTKFFYGGEELYYKDKDGDWVVVGREKNTAGTSGKYTNTTDAATLAEQLKSSYLGKGESTSAFNGKDIDPGKLVIIDGANGVKTDITAWGDPDALTGTTIANDGSKIIAPVGQKLGTDTNGSFTLLPASEAETNFQLETIGFSSRGIHMVAMKDPNFVHKITVGVNGAGTLNLNGGTLTYEFTYFTPLADPSFIDRPSHTSLKIDGAFTVGALGGIISLEFTNGALVQKGFYKLLEASTTIAPEDIKKLSISGLGNPDNSRQTVLLLRGDEIAGIVTDDTVVVPSGTENDLYIYVNPSSAVLHWNTTSNVWEQHNANNEDLANNWLSFDKSITDTSFYENDSVYFCDQNHDEVQGSETTTHHVEIRGEVAPLHIVVDANFENYIFEGTGSITGAGRLKKTGAGTLTIKTSNSFSGGTDISAGTVNALAQKALGTGAVKVYESGTLNVGATSKEDTAIVNDVLSGNLELDVDGKVNIFGSNSLEKGAKINVSGGILNAYATNALGAGTLNVSGGKVYAWADRAFDGNAITLASADSTKKAEFFANATNALGASRITIGLNSRLYANAASIGTNATVTLNGDSGDKTKNGTLVIGADKALDGLTGVDFYMGGTVTVADSTASPDKRDFDISGFTNWNWLAVSANGVIFNIAEKDSSLTASGTKLLNDSIYTINKQGAGSLIIKTTALVDYKGHVYFEGSTREESGEVVIDFGANSLGTDRTTFSGTLSGNGVIRFTGAHGDRDDRISANTGNFLGLRIFNLTDHLHL